MTSCSLILPLAGLGSRFKNQGYTKPKPFIDVLGKPMIYRVLENLEYSLYKKIILIIRDEFDKTFKDQLNLIINEFNCEIVSVPKLTDGPAITVLEGLKHIDLSNPLVVANTDQIVDNGISELVNSLNNNSCDGSILCFEDPTKDKKWSYVKLNNQKEIIETKEKEAISSLATVGIYGFKKAIDCKQSIEEMIEENLRINNEYYVCPAYNFLIRSGKKILPIIISENEMHGIGTPNDLNNYLEKVNN